uniref:CARD domain-containing protein n=1 Tax=Salmo trutta TaxID=8032 RepID=A0A674DZK0_SALTR
LQQQNHVQEQSALEYITNGRRRLIGRLQNLPLIVENLFQRKVLHEEEVSQIQAEVDRFDQTRKILDWVSARGEAACYELLTILDITKKRTLGDADLQFRNEGTFSYTPLVLDTDVHSS